MPAIKELRNSADEVNNAINEMLSGNYENKVDNMTRIGEIIGKISSEYLNGELPLTAKMITRIENTLE